MSYCNNLLNTVTSVTVRTVRYIHAATSIPYGFTGSGYLQRNFSFSNTSMVTFHGVYIL